MHDPARAQERTEARRRGGFVAQHGPGGPERPEVRLQGVGDILALLEAGAADLLARKSSVQRARALAYLASVAVRVLEAGDLEERVSALEARLKLKVS